MTPSLIVMCGLQCSGKSTYAKKTLEIMDNTVYFGSDLLRLKYKYKDNEEVFKELYKRANNALLQGQNVILDATYTTHKSRKRLMNEIKVPCLKEIHIMATPFVECVERLKIRNNSKYPYKLPVEVLDKYHQSFELPFYNEGWFDIKIIPYEKREDAVLTEIFDLDMIQAKEDNFNQLTPYHIHTLGGHRKSVQQNLINYYHEHNLNDIHLLNTFEIYGEIHDIGKLQTQTIDEKTGVAHYYNHANVGAYYLLCHIDEFKRQIFSRSKYKQLEGTYCQMFYDIMLLENYHMRAFDWNTEKSMKKWDKEMGHLYTWLKILNECDKAGAK